MTRTTNSKLAGFTFLFYIVAGITTLILEGRAIHGDNIAAKLASIAAHTTELRYVIVLSLPTSFSALVLGTTLYALTRDEDSDLALLALTCRILEALPGITGTLALLWLVSAADSGALNTDAAHTLGAFLLRGGGETGAIFFAVGSALFSWLLLRGRMIPVALAWLGVVASVLLIVILPLQLAGLLGGAMSWAASITWLVWLPMLVYEVTLALWLLIKGAAMPAKRLTVTP